jgi:hypothetical protein
MSLVQHIKDFVKLKSQINTLKREFEISRFNQIRLQQALTYQALSRSMHRSLNKYEFQVFSQNGEDGIILEILKRLGEPAGYFVEVGIQDGRECNMANLAINFGWDGLMLEGDSNYAKSAQEYFNQKSSSGAGRVNVQNEFITAENFASLLSANNVPKNLDVLSIDVDGVDYWIWKSLPSEYRPRLVIVEYNAYLPHQRQITVPYEPTFSRYQKHPSGYFFGASLAAFASLGKQKGYSLVACDSKGANAFFVRDENIKGQFAPLTPADAYFPLTSGTKNRPSATEAFELIKNMPFAEV